jgi:hypothetical protein
MECISNRTKRILEFVKSPSVKKNTYIKCVAKGCRSCELRETDSGIYCWDHYVNCSECSEPGCHYPAVELGLCRFCLNKDEEDSDEKSMFFSSSLSRCIDS